MFFNTLRDAVQGGLFGGGMPQAPQPNPLFMQAAPPQMTPLQGMGLQSPFMVNRPQQALPVPAPGFTPTRDNAMGPNAMAMLGMNPNMQNMVGPTSALPASMQPQASQLKMWGMEDQLAKPAPEAPPQKDQGEVDLQTLLDYNLLIPNTFDPGNGGHLTRSLISRQSPYSYQGLFGDYISPQAAEWLRLYDSGQGG